MIFVLFWSKKKSEIQTGGRQSKIASATVIGDWPDSNSPKSISLVDNYILNPSRKRSHKMDVFKSGGEEEKKHWGRDRETAHACNSIDGGTFGGHGNMCLLSASNDSCGEARRHRRSGSKHVPSSYLGTLLMDRLWDSA